MFINAIMQIVGGPKSNIILKACCNSNKIMITNINKQNRTFLKSTIAAEFSATSLICHADALLWFVITNIAQLK